MLNTIVEIWCLEQWHKYFHHMYVHIPVYFDFTSRRCNVHLCWIRSAFHQRWMCLTKMGSFSRLFDVLWFWSRRIRNGLLVRHGKTVELALAQVTSAWLEGRYSLLNVILDTIGDGRLSSGPTVTVGAMGIFSPPLKGTIEYYIYSWEQFALGITQEFSTSEESYVCYDCSFAAPLLEVNLSDTALVLVSGLHLSWGKCISVIEITYFLAILRFPCLYF